MSDNAKLRNMAAIVCMDVALKGKPILYARRSESMDTVDSGWEFSCGRTEDEHFEEAQVWAVSEVLELEPSLEEFIAMEEGTELEREKASTIWKVLPPENSV